MGIIGLGGSRATAPRSLHRMENFVKRRLHMQLSVWKFDFAQTAGLALRHTDVLAPSIAWIGKEIVTYHTKTLFFPIYVSSSPCGVGRGRFCAQIRVEDHIKRCKGKRGFTMNLLFNFVQWNVAIRSPQALRSSTDDLSMSKHRTQRSSVFFCCERRLYVQ